MRTVSHQGGLYEPYFSSGGSGFTLVFYEAALSSYGLYEAGFLSGGLYEGGLSSSGLYEAGFSSGGLYEGGLSLWLSL